MTTRVTEMTPEGVIGVTCARDTSEWESPSFASLVLETTALWRLRTMGASQTMGEGPCAHSEVQGAGNGTRNSRGLSRGQP